MTRTRIAYSSFLAMLLLAGCQAKTPQTQTNPTTPATTPTAQPEPAKQDDPAKQENERFQKELAEKKRKSKAHDLNKTDAYRNYVP